MQLIILNFIIYKLTEQTIISLSNYLINSSLIFPRRRKCIIFFFMVSSYAAIDKPFTSRCVEFLICEFLHCFRQSATLSGSVKYFMTVLPPLKPSLPSCSVKNFFRVMDQISEFSRDFLSLTTNGFLRDELILNYLRISNSCLQHPFDSVTFSCRSCGIFISSG